MQRYARLSRWGWSSAVLAVVVAVVAGVVSVVAGSVLAVGQRDAARQQLDRRAVLVTEAVAAETGRYLDTLRVVAAAVGGFEPLTASKFDLATEPLQDLRLAGATSIVYLVPAADDEVASVQQLWRDRGVPDLLLTGKPGVGEHIFSIFNRPLDGNAAPRRGIDVSQAAAPARALAEARRDGRVTVSDAYQLIIDQGLPAGQRQLSFSVTAPVYGPPDADGQRTFRGWVLLGLRGQDFIGATLERISQNLLDVTISAAGADGREVAVATLHAGVPGRRDLRRDAAVTVADRPWQVRVQAAGRRLPGGTTGLPTVVTAAGTLLGLLLAGLVWVLATGRARAHAQVVQATADVRAAETDARRQADLLEAVLDSISDGVGVVDSNGEFLLHNPAAKAILGLDEDKDGAEHWQEHYGIFQPDGTPFPTEQLPLVRALAGEATEQVEMLIRNAGRPDGAVITVSGRPLRTGTGQTGAVAVFHDITDRNAAEAQLRTTRDALADQQAYLTEVLDTIDVAVITCDTTGTIVHANRTARTTLPAGDGPLTIAEANRTVRLHHPDGTPIPLQDTPLMRALRGEDVDGLEAAVPLPDGTRRLIVLHARPLHDTAGHTVGAVAASYNITTLRDREAELRAFAEVAAHDLKAPLAAVAGYTEILDDHLTADTPDPDALRPLLNRVRSGVDRMRRLIDDLLTYATARDGQLHIEAVDLHTVIHDVITERTAHLRTGRDTTGQPALFPDIYTGPLPTVHADKAMIRQLLDNLIGNALKYTLPGQPARIDISAHHRHDDNNRTHIVIADRGIGIPPDDQPHVFTSFHRAASHTGYAGTGLGLAICKRIIDRHGGTIGVTDNPGGGTRIHFSLPTTTPTTCTTDQPSVQQPAPHPSPTQP